MFTHHLSWKIPLELLIRFWSFLLLCSHTICVVLYFHWHQKVVCDCAQNMIPKTIILRSTKLWFFKIYHCEVGSSYKYGMLSTVNVGKVRNSVMLCLMLLTVAPMRGRGFGRSVPQRGDLFRSRPPNTSRPPSLHVDDFVALEISGQQPTGPTGYNKISMRAAKDMMVTRARGRGRAFGTDRGRFLGAVTPYNRRENGRG